MLGVDDPGRGRDEDLDRHPPYRHEEGMNGLALLVQEGLGRDHARRASRIPMASSIILKSRLNIPRALETTRLRHAAALRDGEKGHDLSLIQRASAG